MTNGRGAGMASFMTKKKKYKFQVEICLEELLEVPFVSAVLFAKLRLLDGGNFQDHSSRQEVQDHKVQWGANFTFPCKMMANASTGVMERCVLRISIRKESKGGRSFNKLGFVDLNLAEYAGAGLIHKKALLEGYDARHRQDNSMLKFKIELNMISGDILFKAPSPSLKHKQMNVEEPGNEQRQDEFSSGSLAGSIASGSSGFGSLPKKRPALLSSELVIGQTLTENNVPISIASDFSNEPHPPAIPTALPHQDQHEPQEVALCETGHSRNSSNTSQLSKASGYSSIHSHSHSRQSSSGDSGHIRDLHSRSVRAHPKPKNPPLFRPNTYPRKINIPNTIPTSPSLPFSTKSQNIITSTPVKNGRESEENNSVYGTPKSFQSQFSYVSNSSTDDYRTPEVTMNHRTDVFSQNFNQLQKSSSTSVVERIKTNFLAVVDIENRKSDETHKRSHLSDNRLSLDEIEKNRKNEVSRCKSDFEIPRMPTVSQEKSFSSKFFSTDSLFSFLTPRPKRKSVSEQNSPKDRRSPPNQFKVPTIPNPLFKGLPEVRTTSLGSLRSGHSANDGLTVKPVERGMSHRKLLEGVSAGKLAPLANSPDDQNATVVPVTDVSTSNETQNTPSARRPSVTTNPSSSSLVLSETGSLDRAKAAYERRKKNQNQDSEAHGVPGRVEITRVNPDDLIEELFKNTNLEQTDDSGDNSGLQLFIAKDGTAAVGNHEVKSQMSTGVQVFKQVVMDNR